MKKLTLKSLDGEIFEVEEDVARETLMIKNMVDEDDITDTVIPLPNVSGKVLAKVIEYCKKHFECSKSDDCQNNQQLKDWDADFMKVDQETLFDVMLPLLDLSCQTVADMMKGKSPEEMRKTFHIKNDYTPQEEEEIHRENAWAFE